MSFINSFTSNANIKKILEKSLFFIPKIAFEETFLSV